MESDHATTGAALERVRTLTAGYTPPPSACNSYRAMLDGLETLERDLHRHIHEENNILFPRAIELETAGRPS
jgi:regulator of cell morphogenesis and NO signaling